MVGKRKASSSSSSSSSPSSSSSSNYYSQTATRYQNKINEYETAKYNYQTVWKEDMKNEKKKINEQIKELRTRHTQVSKIDSLRTLSNNIINSIKQLEKQRLKIEKIIETFPKKIQELDDCISYYTNKSKNDKSNNDKSNNDNDKNQSVHCVYSKKSNKKVLKK